MAPDQPGPDDRHPNRIADYLGEPWVWIFVAFIVVAALSIRFVVQPSTSSTGAAVSTTAPRTTPPTTTPPVTTVSPPTSEAAPTTGAPAPTTGALQNSGVWTMPDERGEILSAAKDHIEAIAEGYEVPVMVRDASGQNRRQIIHQNWKVCIQRPGAGQQFTPESGVAFAVVRTNETCPAGGA